MACTGEGNAGINRLQLADAVAEWRSREQLEPSVPSTCPGYWDSDENDASALSSLPGPKPADLYGKFTWKIENFSEISKRELRSNVFEVGGYKWYILVYPQGCDVCNHLSLFLCVADYDKLLPGWSHFAQFTIAVVNKDPKKSKYSDTLHRFCKKEHDWGWKKFMELSKVLDGFTVGDTLVIKAQVQVIRENPHRPFRCLDCQYRRELVRVYITNVEGICRRFVEEKREKLGKIIEDTLRWTSFRAFWSAVEDGVRRRLARERTDIVFKAVVKRFFNEKEVTSTLVMDALYSGCKALDYQRRDRKQKAESGEESFTPIVWMEKEFFVLAGDILSLLERAVLEPLPSYKDDKGPQNRTKEGASGDEFGKEFVERDERRLTELGRRTVEMFVLAHLFSNRIEVAYREAVALKRQEELIREEEAAGQAENELKAKREAAEREKRTKKKQAKQRRKDRKGKDKDSAEKRLEQVTTKQMLLTDSEYSSLLLAETGEEEGPDSGLDSVVGTLGTKLYEDLENGTWERDASSMEASFSGSLTEESTGQSKRLPTALDDSSSTCSSDSLPSVRPLSTTSRGTVLEQANGYFRGRNRTVVDGFESDERLLEGDAVLRTTRSTGETSSSCSGDSEAVILSLKERVGWLEKRLQEKEEEVLMLHEQLSLYQHKSAKNRSGENADCRFSVEVNLSNSRNDSNSNSHVSQSDTGERSPHQKSARTTSTMSKKNINTKLPSANGFHHENGQQHDSPSKATTGGTSKGRNSNEFSAEPRPGMTASAMPAFTITRPATAPMNGPRPSVTYPLQSLPLPLARTVSTGGMETVHGKQALPVSYRNAAVGGLVRPPVPISSPIPSSSPKLPVVYEQQQSVKAEDITSNIPEATSQSQPDGNKKSQPNGKEQDSMSITFGTITQEVLHNEQDGDDGVRNESSSASSPSSVENIRQNNVSVVLSEEFPHLDIINDLLDDDKSLGRSLTRQSHQGGDKSKYIGGPQGGGDNKYLHHQGGDKYLGHPQGGENKYGGDGKNQRRMIENPQIMGSYGHGFWPMSRSMSVNGVSYSGDGQSRYPGHHHVLVPHDGYSVYAPLQ